MTCDCISKVDSALAKHNLEFSCAALNLIGGFITLGLATQWVDSNLAPRGKKRNPTPVYASYCPFCGKPLEEKKTEQPAP